MSRRSMILRVRNLVQDDMKVLLQQRKDCTTSIKQLHHKHTCPATRNISAAASISVEDLARVNVRDRTDGIRQFEDIPSPVRVKNGFIEGILLAVDAYKKDAFRRPHMYAMKNHEQLGPIYRVKMGDGTNFVSLTDPADIERLYHNVGKYPQRVQIEAWQEYRTKRGEEYGVLISDGEAWQKARSALSKRILRPLEIAEHVEAMDIITNCMVDKIPSLRLEGETGNREGLVLNIEKELDKWAMESACKFLFDRRLNLITGDHLAQENVDFFQAIQTLTEVTIYLMMIPYKWHRALKTKPYLRTIDAWDKIFTLSKIYVQDKLNQLASKAAKGQDVNDGSFLSFLMTQDTLTPEQIYSNMTELLTASVDTTSTTSLWCLHLLSRNPEVQEKLHEEVTRVLPVNRSPTREEIDSMTYLKAVIKETLRMFPVTQGTARILPQDTTIRNYNIPAGTAVQTFFFGSGNDPTIFKDASKFQPERWLDGSCRHLGFASQPFGFGTRMCLGRRLAEQEMYLLISKISRRFIVKHTKENIGHVCKVLITPDQPLELKFIDRK